MEAGPDSRRTIASYVPPRALAGRTRAALEGLGYRIVPAVSRGRFGDDAWEPDLRLVDERHLDRIPTERYLPRTPVILLTGARPLALQDPRVVGSVKRPATLGSLYPILQRALETTPRIAPRAPTRLPARCSYADRRWMGAVVSLSAGGCLFMTGEPMPLGQEINMLFPLPLGRMISTRARVVDERRDSVGLEFASTAPVVRDAVASYVETRLATH